MITVDLHLTLHQLHRRNYESNQKSCKCSVFKPISIAELSFVPDSLIHLIRAEDKGMNNGIRYERIVNPTKELHETFVLDDMGYGLHHS